MTEFSIRAVSKGRQRTLVLSGEIDLQVAENLVQAAHSQLVGTDVQRLVIDLGAVTFMDSTGLGALVAVRNAATKQGTELVLANVPERIRQLLGLTGLAGVFAVNSDGPSGSRLGGQDSAAQGSDTDAPTDPQLRIVPT